MHLPSKYCPLTCECFFSFIQLFKMYQAVIMHDFLQPSLWSHCNLQCTFDIRAGKNRGNCIGCGSITLPCSARYTTSLTCVLGLSNLGLPLFGCLHCRMLKVSTSSEINSWCMITCQMNDCLSLWVILWNFVAVIDYCGRLQFTLEIALLSLGCVTCEVILEEVMIVICSTNELTTSSCSCSIDL